MRSVSRNTADKGVSEIIGTILIFAIGVSFFTSVLAWYVPVTGKANDSNFQAQTQSSLASLISQLESQSIPSGSVISQNIPMGISGELLNPATSTQLRFNNSGFSVNLSFDLKVGYKLIGNKEPSSVSNVVFNTYPQITGKGPVNSFYDKRNNNIYVTDFCSNSVSVINATSGTVIKNIYAGIEPWGIAYDNFTKDLYVTDFYSYYNSITKANFSTITVISTLNNSVVCTINTNGADQYLDSPTGIAFDNVQSSPNRFLLFISDYYHVPPPANAPPAPRPPGPAGPGPGQAYYVPSLTVLDPSNPNDPNVSHPSIITNRILTAAPAAGPAPPPGGPGPKPGPPPAGPASNLGVPQPFASQVFVYNYTPTDLISLNDLNDLDGAVIITEYYNNSLYILGDYNSSSSSIIPNFNYYIGGSSQFADPLGMAIDPQNGTLYVVDYNNNTTNAPIGPKPPQPPGPPPNTGNGQPVGPPPNPGPGRPPGPPTSKSYNGNITIVEPSLINGSLEVIGTIKVPLFEPTSIAYFNNTLYITDYEAFHNSTGQYDYSKLTLVNATTPSLNYTINTNGSQKLFLDPYQINYIPKLQKFIITMNGTNAIAIMNATPYSLHPVFKFYFTGLFNTPIAISGVSNYLFVADRSSDSVSVYSQSTNSVLHTYEVGLTPDAIAYVPVTATSGYVYVANNASNNLTLFTFTSGSMKFVKNIPTGPGSHPTGLLYDSINNYLYIMDTGNSKIALLSKPTNPTYSNPVWGKNFTLKSGTDPYGAALDPLKNIVLVTDFGSNTVQLISNGTCKNFTIAKPYSAPIAATFDPQNDEFYVANFGTDCVSIVSPSLINSQQPPAPALPPSFAVGQGPDGIAYDPYNGYIYVSNFYSNDSTLYNTQSSSVVDTIVTGGGPSGTYLGPNNGYVYISNYYSNQITVIEGGTIIFNSSTAAENLLENFASSGEITDSAYTQFIPQQEYIIQGGNLISYTPSSNNATAYLSLPLSLVGNVNSSAVRVNVVSITGQDQSISRNGGTQIRLLAASSLNNSYYLGQRILYTDFYHNSYYADVIGLNMTNLLITISSNYIQAWDNVLYSVFNNTKLVDRNAPSQWAFSSLPFTVIVSGNQLALEQTSASYSIHSVSIVYYQFQLEEL
jgi:YVTN family beta-propeller protein